MRTTCLLVPILLAACSGSRTAASPRTPSIQITSANAVVVARTALHASLGLADVAGMGAGVVTTVPPDPTASVSLPALALCSLAELTMPGTALSAHESTTIPGAEGGEVVRTWDDRDENERVSTGDLFTLTFAAFAEDGLVLDGTMQFDSLVVDGNLGNGLAWIVRTRLQFVDLAITAAGVTETLHGSLWCTREKRATVMTLEMEVAEGFTVVGMELAAGTKLAYHEYTLDLTFAQFAKGAVESEAIGGRMEFETKVPFTGIQFLPNPSVGELEVRGAGGSVITITAVDFFTVEIALDADGDGEVEQTLSMEWAEL